MLSNFSQELWITSLHSNGKGAIFKWLHSETHFENFAFSGPQDTIVT